MIVRLLVSLFVVFAVSRVWLRYREGSVDFLGATLWSVLWIGVSAVVWWPRVSDVLAHSIGVGRGFDAVVTVSVIALLYAVFRLYVKMESIDHEITNLVRRLALDQSQRENKGRSIDTGE